MRGHYRGQSISVWLFWAALLVGGTLYGAHRFDWFPVAFLGAGPKEAAQVAESATPTLPPEGQIHLSASSPAATGAAHADEPIDAPIADGERPARTRLLEQRAEGPKPSLRANAPSSAAMSAGNLDNLAVDRPAFATAAVPQDARPQSAVIQASNSVTAVPAQFEPDELPAAAPRKARSKLADSPVDAALQDELDAVDKLIAAEDILEAHRQLSTTYWSQPASRAAIADRIRHTSRSIYFDAQPHYLNPYIVKPGDEIGALGKRFNVPAAYLAKLNRLDPKHMKPGQRLKVVKGPFAAIVELERRLITVHAYGYVVKAYQFELKDDAQLTAAKLSVRNKFDTPESAAIQAAKFETGAPPVGRSIDLGDGLIILAATADAAPDGLRLQDADLAELFDMLGIGSEVTIRP